MISVIQRLSEEPVSPELSKVSNIHVLLDSYHFDLESTNLHNGSISGYLLMLAIYIRH